MAAHARAGGGDYLPHLRPRPFARQTALSRHQPRRDLRLLHRHTLRRIRLAARCADAELRRKLRTYIICLHPRPASGPRLYEHLPHGRRTAQPARPRRGGARHRHGTPRRPARLYAPARHDGRALRRNDQHARPRCGTADAQAARPALQRRRPRLRRDLSHRHDWRDYRPYPREGAAAAPRRLSPRRREQRRSFHCLLHRVQPRRVPSNAPRP